MTVADWPGNPDRPEPVRPYPDVPSAGEIEAETWRQIAHDLARALRWAGRGERARRLEALAAYDEACRATGRPTSTDVGH